MIQSAKLNIQTAKDKVQRTYTPKKRIGHALNILVRASIPVVLFITIKYIDSLSLSLLIIFITKWQVFLVKPRFWWPHLKSNSIDYIVSFSVVFIAWLVSSSNKNISGIALQDYLSNGILISVLIFYAAWLLYIKTKSSQSWMIAQAFSGLILGLLSLSWIYAYVQVPLDEYIVGIGGFIICYSFMQHCLFSYSHEENVKLYSVLWAGIISPIFVIQSMWQKHFNIIAFKNRIYLPIIVLIIASIAACLVQALSDYKKVESNPTLSKQKHNNINHNIIISTGLAILIAISASLINFFF
jgi:hypothetical protein